MPMPNTQTTDNQYRYAFQGQEKDPETGMEAFELRLWDGRLGRWLTVDPMHQYASPYLGMGNNPISRVDPNGGADGADGKPGKGFWGRLWSGIFGGGNSEYKDIPKNDIAYSVQLNEVSLKGFNHISNGVNSHLIGGLGLTGNYPIGSTTNGFLALPRDFGDWNSAGSDGRQWIGCMACHGNNGAYRTVAYDSPSRYAGLSIAATFNAAYTPGMKFSTGATTKTASPFALESTQPIMLSQRQFQKLVNDIKTNGVISPVEYTVKDGIKYIVNGHHRVYIAKRLGINTIPVQEVPYQQGMEVVQEGSNPGYLKYIKY
jgi:RHS repeat-associated protein